VTVGPKTGERWKNAAPHLGGLSVAVSADGETALIVDPDGDVCTLPREAWVPVADALLALHVAASRR
jgi:hypothetical protein